MTLIVSITAAAGFLASYLLLGFGLQAMWLRYACAVGCAYLAFLLLLWLWLRTQASDYTDLPDISDLIPAPRGGGAGPGTFSGNGGSFDGGGASASFESAEPLATPAVFETPDKVGEAIGAAADADEFSVPLIVVILFAVLVLSSAWIVYSAPALFAEVLLDGALATGLYRRLRKLEARNWLGTAVRKTLLPFVATAVLVSACGWAMTLYAPEAISIGQVMSHARQVR